MTALEFAADFQTAIVGVVGFSGVIIAQLVNGSLARKREEIALEVKRDAVTAAFKAELVFAQQKLARASEFGSGNGVEIVMPRNRRRVTLSMMPEIGYVKTNSIEKLVYALATIDTIDSNLSDFVQLSDDRVRVPGEKWSLVSSALANAAKSLDEAIEALEK